jgi:regulator of protease activity HflC (stomatin/prohibitin superfamily)
MTINIKTILGGIVFFALLVVTLLLINWETVRGYEIGVKETWGEGVIEEPLQPGVHWMWPAYSQKIYKYPVNQQVFVMNDNKEDFAEGRDADAYEVQSADQQTMWISLTVQWRIDPLKVVSLHKTVRDAMEERLIRPEVMLTVKNAATERTALTAYSGAGLVALQTEIEGKLRDEDGELRTRGIIVDTFVIERIKLDPQYTDEIKAKQVAIQRTLRNQEEEKAAVAAAAKAKAEAQADYEKQVVEAERDKQKGILEAEKEAEQMVLAAEAEKRKIELQAEAEKAKRVLEAEGLKEADILRSVGILAVGEAEAEATQLKMAAYATSGADAYVTMQVAESMKGAYAGVKGWVPENMTIDVISDNFVDGIQMVVDPTAN